MKNKLAAQLIAAALAMGTVFSGSVVYAAPTATTPYRTLIEHVETSTSDDLLTAEAVDLYAKGGVADFVERLYTVVLGRKSDLKGKQAWIDALTSHRNTGAEVAAGFFFSDEYKKQNKSNKDYVNDLYRTMLGRNCDSAGFTAWIGQLEDGVSRSGIYAGFVYSQEFNKICQDYGINRGDYSSTEERDQNAQVTAFVQRLYRNVLQRNGEVGGLNAWAGVLNRKEESGAAVAAGFILSPEYLNKKITVEDYVEMMYQTLLNRSSDPAGKRSWVNAIVDGSMRACDLISGFAGSKEFQQLCERYGIVSGAGETFDGDFPNMILERTPCNHTWVSRGVTKPTCVQYGDELFLCTTCGEMKTELIPPTGKHTYSFSEVIQKATCENEGLRILTCSVCNSRKEESIPATGHSYKAAVVTVKPTCTTEGKEVSTCSSCGDKKETVLPATGHSYGKPVVTEPTCGKEGKKVTACSVCGDQQIEVLAPTGNHSYGAPVITAATCTKDGKKVTTCTVCSDEKVDVIPATGHSYKEQIVTDPTCGTEGKKLLTCSTCGDHKEEAIPATGKHTYGDPVVTDPTCTKEGSKVYTCTVCGDEKTKVLEKIAHELQDEITEMVLADEDLGYWVENVVSAYHGYYQESVTICNKCKTEFTGENQILRAIDHEVLVCHSGYHTESRYDRTKWMDREEYTIMKWRISLTGGQMEHVRIITCKNCNFHETRKLIGDFTLNPPIINWESDPVESFKDDLVPRPAEESYIIGDPTVHVRDLE